MHQVLLVALRAGGLALFEACKKRRSFVPQFGLHLFVDVVISAVQPSYVKVTKTATNYRAPACARSDAYCC